MAPKRPDETWHRLRDWTYGQAPSERLAAQILYAENFTDIDPSHPLGGPDGGRDGVAKRDGKRWVMSVYFPKGQKRFGEIKRKFEHDVRGVTTHKADGIAFVTNQELTLAQRDKLSTLSPDSCEVELYHLERCTASLDRPRMGSVRRQFHLEDENENDRLIGAQTGGDTIARFMLYHFDMGLGIAQEATLIKEGEHALLDVHMRIVDLDRVPAHDLIVQRWDNVVAPAEFYPVRMKLPDTLYWRIFFTARNGSWHQDLILRKSERDNCWLAATQIIGLQGAPQLEFTDNEFTTRFGDPEWRA